ncbi:hypothetical protein I6L78_02425 [Proteus vulgaris]|uniref:hypothetical protein n=1 Tax=Proteus vulgaris TaxID=585 RepID=UPI001C5A92E5|nr:hypothetical protein [Proteus vulgaris]MBW3470979.1 hypothetical protein [Proteus vulgaris]
MKNNELALLLDSPIMDIYKLETLLTIWLEAEDNQDIANMISISLDYTKNVRDALSHAVGSENNV